MDDIPKGSDVAAYFRASTTNQKNSVKQQDSEVGKTIKRFNLHLVKSYADDGVSGSTIEERDDFLRMIDEVKGLGIKYILVYHIDRFTRGGHTQFWPIIQRLKKYGILVYCCTHKLFITEQNAAQFLHAITQAREYAVNLSRLIGRSMVANFAEYGNAPGSKPPFGFDREYVDESGIPFQRLRLNTDGSKSILDPITLEEKMKLPKGTRFPKVKTHSVRLVPSDPKRVAIVKRIFTAIQSMGFAEVADMLDSDGEVSPTGGTWSGSTIRDLVMNPVYKGDLVFNRTSKARYHKIVGGEVTPLDEFKAGKLNFADNPKEQWMVLPEAHEALVTPDEWQAAQDAIEARGGGTLRTTRSPNRVYILSGIASCGRCGAPLQGNTQRAKNGKAYPRYICANAQKSKKKCPRASISAEKMESFVLNKAREVLTLDCVEEELRAGLGQRYDERQVIRDDLDGIRRELEEVRKERKSLFKKLKGDDVDFFKEEIDDLKAQENRLKAREATALVEKGSTGDRAEFVRRGMEIYEKQVLQLQGGCETAIRECLRALGTKVVYHPDGKDGTIEVFPFVHSVED